jgi:glutathione S-transferase
VKKEHKSKEYMQVNPNGTIPGLKYGDTCLGQSREIARYLVDNFYPGHSLYPPEMKAEIDELLKFDEEKCFVAAVKIAVSYSIRSY